MKEIKPYGRKVQYYETDAMRIVHHSNYIRWLEEARMDTLEQAGLSYEVIEASGVMIPVLSAECEYRISFRYGDAFEIKVTTERFNGIKLYLKYEIYGREDGQLHAVGRTGHCFLDSQMRPVRLKKVYPDIYNTFFSLLNRE